MEEAEEISSPTKDLFGSYNPSYKLTSPRILTKEIKNVKEENWRIEKVNDAGPGSYNSPSAFDKT